MAVNAGATEKTPSVPQYFSWINNTNEGSTERQTLANLDFFHYLNKTYGMQLKIYAFDAGNLDNPGDGYGTFEDAKYKRQFPRGFRPIVDKAKESGIRLGIWGGPDGFGDTPEEEAARRELLVSLCRDYNFMLLKIDGVCGNLRPEKQAVFRDTLDECRSYCPDFILLNHRLDLGIAKDRSTTFLWEGAETYVDVFLTNVCTAPHHRARVMSRGYAPELKRLSEDHGVCISSCLDYWEDDMILQAFNRCMILAPEMYGNPWLLRDDELAKLARIYNLHGKYGSILVNGIELDEKYGMYAVSRGSESHRFLTLRNISWNTIEIPVKLDEEIGLTAGSKVLVKIQHPYEEVIGHFETGETVMIPVLPFRSCLVDIASDAADDAEDYITGCPYRRTTPGRFELLGLPGQTVTAKHYDGSGKLIGEKQVTFGEGGTGNEAPDYLCELLKTDVPVDAETLYETTVFTADNNSLEWRSLQRSGPSKIPEVNEARRMFFEQETYRLRGVEDNILFDGNPDTWFDGNSLAWHDMRLNGGVLRIDCGSVIEADTMEITCFCTYKSSLEKNPDGPDGVLKIVPIPEIGDTSPDLKQYTPFCLEQKEILAENIEVPSVKSPVHTLLMLNGDRVRVTYKLGNAPFRYVRLPQPMNRIYNVSFYKNGKLISLDHPRANNLFSPYAVEPVTAAWKNTVRLDSYVPGSYLCVGVEGKHGSNKVFAVAKIGDRYIGAPDRATSYPSNVWEFCVHYSDENNTFYIPMQQEYAGKDMEIYVLLMEGGQADITPQVYLAYDKDKRYSHEEYCADGTCAGK